MLVARIVVPKGRADEAQYAAGSAQTIRQPIENLGDIDNAFDDITYEKAAAVIGMFRNGSATTFSGVVSKPI